MKFLGENEALEKLAEAKAAYRQQVAPFEAKAKDCLTCETQGACCLDAHFVNVQITKLEAVAMKKELEKRGPVQSAALKIRIAETIEEYRLEDPENEQKTFACPLFEKGTGCLVHAVKPVPCIQHACYENKEDLPPDELQFAAEHTIDRLNKRTYSNSNWLPLPLWLHQPEQKP
jgi:hypothetical protein